MIRLIYFAAVVALVGAPAREEVSREFSRKVTLPAGARVSITSKNGDVVVRGAAGNEASVRAFLRVSAAERADAEKFAGAVAFDVTTGAGELRLHVRYPDGEPSRGFWDRIFGGRQLGYSVRLELQLPEGSPLEVRNGFGAVEVDEMKGGATIVNSNGPVVVRKGRGALRLETSFGRIHASRIAGDTVVANDNGDVTLSEITGNAWVRTRFGAVDVAHVSGSVEVQNDNQSVTVSDVGGRATLTTSFGGVTANRVRGDLMARNNNGSIDLTDITGGAEVTTSFGKVRFSNVGKWLSVKNDNGAVEGYKVNGNATVRTSFAAVQIAEVAGDAVVQNDNGGIALKDVTGGARLRTKFGTIDASRIGKVLTANNDNGSIHVFNAVGGSTVATKFGGIKLDGAGGPVEATNDNGEISVSTRRGPVKGCEPIRLATKFSPIRVTLPAGGGDYDLSASTHFGKIHANVTVAVQGEQSENKMAGRIGRGGCELRLTNDNGGIDINAAQN